MRFEEEDKEEGGEEGDEEEGENLYRFAADEIRKSIYAGRVFDGTDNGLHFHVVRPRGNIGINPRYSRPGVKRRRENKSPGRHPWDLCAVGVGPV